jgi:hypothetical protein
MKKTTDLYEQSIANKTKKTTLDFSIGLQKDRIIATSLLKVRAVHFNVTQDDEVGENELMKYHDSDVLLSDDEEEKVRVNDGEAKEDGNAFNAEADDGILCPDNLEIDESAEIVCEEVPSANFISIVQNC